MANIGDLVANLSINSRGFSAGLGNARRELAGFSMFANRTIGGFGSGLLLTGAVTGLLAIAGASLKLAADAETAEAAFTTLTGSLENARGLMGQLKAFAKESPFSIAGAYEAGKQLMAYGFQIKDVLPTMKMLGDIAMGDTDKFNRLAYAVGQIKGFGKLRAQEKNQLTNAGFPIMELLSKSMGKSVDEVSAMMEQGHVGYSDVMRALKEATSEGGRFFNSTRRHTETLAGRFQNLTEEIADTGRELGNALVKALDIKQWLVKFTDIAKQFRIFFANLDDIVKLGVTNWQISLEEWSAGAGGVLQNFGIVFSTFWESMGKDFGTFTDTMRAGFAEIFNLFDAYKQGIANAATDNIFVKTMFQMKGVEPPAPLLDRFTGKPLSGIDAFNKVLAGQKDPMKQGSDWLSTWRRRMLEENKKAQDALGGGPLLDKLKAEREEILKRIGINEAGRNWKPPGGKDDEDKKRQDMAKDKAVSDAALKGSSEAAKRMLSGVGSTDQKLLVAANKQVAGINQVAINTAPLKNMPQFMTAEV